MEASVGGRWSSEGFIRRSLESCSIGSEISLKTQQRLRVCSFLKECLLYCLDLGFK